jgi:uncharacterized phage protein gp47/JayE
MPDSFDSNGLKIKSLDELKAELIAGLQVIYGSDINVDSNSPDGQLLGLISQEAVDLRELLLNINSGFDPDQAEGNTLDQRCALVGVKRGSGTFTTVQIDVVTTKALNLVGLDTESGIINPQVINLYTIKDDAGNLWYLLSSQFPSGSGTYTYTFQSAAIGAVQVVANTITTPVTIIDGVSTVNNPSGALYQGIDEETDANLRVRFHKATTITAVGFSDSLQSLLENLPTVDSAQVWDNDTPTTDTYGTPANSIWCIVEGGYPADIAQAIYSKKGAGAGMRGAITHNVTRPNGQVFVAKWDVPNNVNLWIKFSVNLPGGGVDRTAMKTTIADGLFWDVGGDAVGDVVTEFVRKINPLYRVTGMLLSEDNITYTEIRLSASPINRFVNATTRMTISS